MYFNVTVLYVEQVNHRAQLTPYQCIEYESISKLGKLFEGLLELAPSCLDELHALVDAGQTVEGGGQGVEGVGLLWCPTHCLAQVRYHRLEVGQIFCLKRHLYM